MVKYLVLVLALMSCSVAKAQSAGTQGFYPTDMAQVSSVYDTVYENAYGSQIGVRTFYAYTGQYDANDNFVLDSYSIVAYIGPNPTDPTMSPGNTPPTRPAAPVWTPVFGSTASTYGWLTDPLSNPWN